MSFIRRPTNLLIVLILSGLFASCVETSDDIVDSLTAQKRIYASYAAKSEQCGKSLPFVLPVIGDTTESSVNLCENGILALDCDEPEFPKLCISVSPLGHRLYEEDLKNSEDGNGR